MKTKFYTEQNQQAWNTTAKHHHEDARWQNLVAGFTQADFSTLDETITSILNELPVLDKSVVQVGCNNGRELLSVMSLGARAGLGIDQSEAFLEQAKELNDIAKKECEFLHSDIYDLPESVSTQFDVALITIGVLGWMPDLPRFFAAVASLLNQQGRLVIYETHPFLEMFLPENQDPFKPSISYFNNEPYRGEEAIVYDGSDPGTIAPWYWFNHRFDSVINGCIESGLSIDKVQEYAHSNREVEFDIYLDQPVQLPLCFSLIASKS